tara:strand:- start:5821 stop:6048 length:228 start_codon:yes stop_codon:yes gene_type:complete
MAKTDKRKGCTGVWPDHSMSRSEPAYGILTMVLEMHHKDQIGFWQIRRVIRYLLGEIPQSDLPVEIIREMMRRDL